VIKKYTPISEQSVARRSSLLETMIGRETELCAHRNCIKIRQTIAFVIMNIKHVKSNMTVKEE